jgi:putative aldouronate transport system substrate-binding protein
VPRVEGKLTIWSPGDNGTVLDWATDPILQKVQEATGVQINMVKVSWDTYNDQVNAAIASGQMPDLVCCIDTSNHLLINQWVRDGVIAPFEGAVAAAAPNVLAQYEKNPTLDELKIDGKIYADPIEWGYGNEPNFGILHVRKDLLDTYGLQPPETFEEYFAFLRRAKEDGKTGVLFDGQEGPGNALNAFLGAFGLPANGWVKVDGSWQHWSVQPKVKDALLLFHQMNTEGLIDPVSWESANTARDQYVAGQAAALIFNGGGHIGRIQNDMDLAGQGAKNWVLPALDAGAGSRGYMTEPMFWAATFIGNMQGNQPEAAAKVLNYLGSEEGYRLTAIGVEGVDYKGSGEAIELLPERTKRGFPTEAGDTGAHPLASPLVSWVPLEWQEFALLYGKDQSFKDWYNQMRANQTKYQTPSFGLLTATQTWTDFSTVGGELQQRAFIEITRAEDAKTAGARFDQFVQEWKGAGGDAATAEMSEALNQIYS